MRRISLIAMLAVLCVACNLKEPTVHNFLLNDHYLAIKSGETHTITATISPYNAPIRWSTSDPLIASVNQEGTVKAYEKGIATITARVGKRSDFCHVEVYYNKVIPVEDIWLNESTLRLKVGDTDTLKLSIKPADANNKTVLWRSSDNNVVSVADGVLTAKAPGQAEIKATVSILSATCEVVVDQ